MTDNWQEILEDEEIQLVIELMGGVEPARTYIVQALEAGKQVVTANKDVLAEHGQEILSLAENSGCDIQFEAAVAGAIPIIRPLKQSLAGSMLTEIMGIVNGTTNYILTKMSEEGDGLQRKRWQRPQSLDMRRRIRRRTWKLRRGTKDRDHVLPGVQLQGDLQRCLYGRDHEDHLQ